MEIKDVVELLPILGQAPTLVVVILSSITAIIGLWMKYGHVKIEEKTSASNIQKTQMESLMAQIELLSHELVSTRTQITELHNQNIVLMGQLREANHRIGELELLLERRDLDQR